LLELFVVCVGLAGVICVQLAGLICCLYGPHRVICCLCVLTLLKMFVCCDLTGDVCCLPVLTLLKMFVTYLCWHYWWCLLFALTLLAISAVWLRWLSCLCTSMKGQTIHCRYP